MERLFVISTVINNIIADGHAGRSIIRPPHNKSARGRLPPRPVLFTGSATTPRTRRAESEDDDNVNLSSPTFVRQKDE